MIESPASSSGGAGEGGAATPAEAFVWEGRPSQWTNILPFLSCLLLLPIPWAVYRWIATRCTTYSFSNQRLRLKTGILNRKIDDLELYRVKDSTIHQPLLQRLVGLGTIELVTSDATTPRVWLRAIERPIEVHDLLRAQVERLRRERGVRELDISSESDFPPHAR